MQRRQGDARHGGLDPKGFFAQLVQRIEEKIIRSDLKDNINGSYPQQVIYIVLFYNFKEIPVLSMLFNSLNVLSLSFILYVFTYFILR